MYKKVEGVVVSEYPYEESSKIIKVLTKDNIISIIAKGAKKLKSPFFAGTSVLSHCLFNISYKENGLSRLTDIDILNDFRNIRKDISKISYSTYITELVTKVYNHEKNKNIYELYLQSLNKINEGYDPMVITDILRLKLLENLGIKPVIDNCIECGNKNYIVTISSYHGGLICQNCYRGEKIVSPKTIKLLRMLYYVDLGKITKLDISDLVKSEINEFINDYYERYSGIYLKSNIIVEKNKNS